MKKVIFSGIQPSGNLHIGNYIGAIQQWVKLQEETESIFCIVDLHAITVPQDTKILREKVLEVAALYLACGIDPKKTHIFVQSENPNHPYLAWIFDCILSMGQLYRMTQFKDKQEKYYREMLKKTKEEKLNAFEVARMMFEGPVGIFNYPALMAADILLYQTDEVPVGEDQKQHIELTRDLADKFNRDFGQTFKLPKPLIQKETAKIMSLQDPRTKMSKSDKDPDGTIDLLDDEKTVINKIRGAVTDSGKEILKKEDKPAISNLLTVYAAITGKPVPQIEKEFKGKTYVDFKDSLAFQINVKLGLIQQDYNSIRSKVNYLRQVLDEGRDYAIEKSSKTLGEVKEKMGLLY